MKKLLLVFLTLTIFTSCGEKTTADKLCDLTTEMLDLANEYKDNRSEMPAGLINKLDSLDDKGGTLAKKWEEENPDLSGDDLEKLLMEDCEAYKELMTWK